MKKLILCSLVLYALFSFQGLMAQNRVITGNVSDPEGLPITGVTVVVKGTSIGTISGINGDFELDIPETAETLIFSFIGMKTQEMSVEGITVFSIQMEEEAIGIAEVVAIGYGSQRKADITGAVSSVRSEDFNPNS